MLKYRKRQSGSPPDGIFSSSVSYVDSGDIIFDYSKMFFVPAKEEFKRMLLSDFDLYVAACKVVADSIVSFYENKITIIMYSNRISREFDLKLVSNAERDIYCMFEYNKNISNLEFLLTALNKYLGLIPKSLDLEQAKYVLSYLEDAVCKQKLYDINNDKMWAREWRYAYGDDIRRLLASVLINEGLWTTERAMVVNLDIQG